MIVSGMLLSDVWSRLFRPRLRVLFLGNSLTRFGEQYDIPALCAAIAPRPWRTAAVTRDGGTLEDHRGDSEAGRLLRPGAWDVVVLQENSERAVSDPAGMEADVRRLDRWIRSMGAKTAFYSTAPGSGKRLCAELGALWLPAADAWDETSRTPGDGHLTSAGAALTAALIVRILSGKDAAVEVPVASGDRPPAE